jgi:hypothetical protein
VGRDEHVQTTASGAGGTIKQKPDDSGRSKPSPLFYLVVVATTAAGIAGLCATPRQPGYALDSSVVYRVEVSAAVLLGLYFTALSLWLAWHGKGFFKLEIGPAKAEALGAEHIENAAADLEGLREDFEQFRREADEALRRLDERLHE